jgi:hypothetical protein
LPLALSSPAASNIGVLPKRVFYSNRPDRDNDDAAALLISMVLNPEASTSSKLISLPVYAMVPAGLVNNPSVVIVGSGSVQWV